MTTITEALKQLKEEQLTLWEDKADDIYNQYYSDMDRADFDAIWNADPTSTAEVKGKFVQWLINRHKKGEDVLGQLERIKKCISAYMEDKSKYNKALGTGDINGLDLNTFLNTVENTDKTAFRQFLEGTGEVTTIASSKEYEVFHPLSFEGNSYIVGKKNTQDYHHDLNWCTGYCSDDGNFRSYGGDYYCFIWKQDRTNKDKCYQINIRSGDVEYFLNGYDQRPQNGGDDYKECFVIFLISQPDLLQNLKDTVLYDRCETLREAWNVWEASTNQKPITYKGEYFVPFANKYLRTLIQQVEVENGVKQIKPGVFANCSNLKSVDIPGSVEIIGARAFSECVSLNTLNLSEGLKDIRALAFLGDISLKRVDIPDSLENLDISAFKDCSNVVLRVNNLDGKRYIEVGDNLTENDYRWLRKHVKQIRQ